MNFSVQPTLFIGIGTTGTDILNRLRKYFYEEFGTAGLPCFRYLAFETHAENKPDDTFLPHAAADYERINMIHITIPQVDVIKSRLEPGRDNYLRGVDEWLDQRLLNGTYPSFVEGAGHRRQAGRLCLWENWSKKVKPQLVAAFQALQTNDMPIKTDQFLREKYLPKKLVEMNANLQKASLVKNVPRIIITGTLCGGTGSGIFIDLAYYSLIRLLGERTAYPNQDQRPQLMGMFTIPDVIGMHDDKSRPHAVNTWTALKELDFYSRGAEYRAMLPDGDLLQSKDSPFDMVYLAGMANVDGKSFGQDHAGLADMCALNLFAEMVPAIAAPKGEIRVNFQSANAGYMEPNDKGFIRAFSSFGLSAIWYPRYRIVKAITLALGQDIAKFWMGVPEFNSNKVEEELLIDWRKMISDANGRLIGTMHDAQVGANIPEEIRSMFLRHQEEFCALEEASLHKFIVDFPSSENTLTEKFSSPEGEHFRRIANSKASVAKSLADAVSNRVAEYLASHTIIETIHYLERLIQTVEEAIKISPESLQPFRPLSAEGDLLAFSDRVFHDFPTRILGLRSKAREEYKRHIWTEFGDLTVAHAEMIGSYFLGQILRHVIENIRRLRDQVRAAANQLSAFEKQCASNRLEHVNYPASVNVFPISRGNPERLEDDVEMGLAEIRIHLNAADLKRRFIGTSNALTLLNAKPAELVALVEREFDRDAQSEAMKFQIGAGALESFRGRMADIVHAAAPYTATATGWSSLATRLPHSPNMVFCHEEIAGKNIAASGSEQMRSSRAFDYKESPMDHFVLFYREEPGLAISDLKICEGAERIVEEYETESREKGNVTAYTHKMGEKFFNISIEREYRSAQDLVKLSILVAPDLFPRSGSQHYLEYEENGFKRSLHISDGKSLRDFLNDRGLTQLQKLTHHKLQGLGLDSFRERVNQTVTAMAQGQPRTETQQKLERLAAQLFPNV